MIQSANQYDYKYSDRDVREDRRLYELAVSYLNQYGGTFEPLLRAKMAMVDGHALNVPQARMVLNCMRHDAQVSDSLPKPRYPFVVPRDGSGGGKVVDLMPRLPRQRNRREPIRQLCDRSEPHDVHENGFGEDEFGTVDVVCPGVLYPINRPREWKRVDAIVKAKYAAGPTGNLVHKTTGQAYTEYLPKRHEWGWKDQIFKVKLVCKNPGWLAFPWLFREEPAHLYHDPEMPRGRCSRCFSAEELREPLPKPRPNLTPLFLPPELAVDSL